VTYSVSTNESSYLEAFTVIIVRGQPLNYSILPPDVIIEEIPVEVIVNHTIYENVTITEIVTEYIDYTPTLQVMLPVFGAEIALVIIIWLTYQRRRGPFNSTTSNRELFDETFGS
jgi:hypothetical protein